MTVLQGRSRRSQTGQGELPHVNILRQHDAFQRNFAKLLRLLLWLKIIHLAARRHRMQHLLQRQVQQIRWRTCIPGFVISPARLHQGRRVGRTRVDGLVRRSRLPPLLNRPDLRWLAICVEELKADSEMPGLQGRVVQRAQPPRTVQTFNKRGRLLRCRAS